MKREARTILTILFTTFATSITYSQTDSVKVQYSQEEITKANKMDEAICDILTRREKSSKDLWKFDLAGTFLGGFDIAYERKLTPNWSFNIQSVTNFAKTTYEKNGAVLGNLMTPLRDKNKDFGFSQGLNFQLRCYYNLNRRTRLGKKSGFSGNYFGLSSANEYVFERVKEFKYFTYPDNTVVVHNIPFHLLHNSVNVIYGIQRKTGKIGYIDFNAGVGLAVQSLFGPIPDGTKEWRVEHYLSLPIKLGIGIAF